MKILSVVALILAVAILARVAWLRWPPVGRCMVRHTQIRMREAARQYLEGKRDVESVATEILQRSKWVQRQGWPPPDMPEEGVATLEPATIEITPSGYSSSNPRLVALVEKITELWMQDRTHRTQNP